MILHELHNFAESKGIEIMQANCPKSGSMSIMTDNGDCYIGIDEAIINGADELVRTAHEVGHCETGAFYNRYSKFNVVEKMEYKADKWATLALIPPQKLYEALENGYREYWELAELFGVTIGFIERAFYIYRAMDVIKPMPYMD